MNVVLQFFRMHCGNRLAVATRAGVLVNIRNAGYWFPETPLPPGYVPPLKLHRNPESKGARSSGRPRGRQKVIKGEKLARIEAALRAGKTVKQIVIEQGVSAGSIYSAFLGGAAGLKQLPPPTKRKK
jgi:hypothetical protein